ncbi:MAG: methionyl-tRNA formyltransferase [Streptococcus salivarius]
MDAGDMIAQDSTPILEDDNVGTMFEKLALVGRDLLLETLPKYLSGQLKAQAQNEDEVTFSPNISPEEEKIDWNKSAREIFNKVRGMNPFPVAHTTWNGERFKIYETKVVDDSVGNLQAGEIVEKTKKSLKVATGEGLLELFVQPAGKPKMDIVSFLNGLGQKYKLEISLATKFIHNNKLKVLSFLMIELFTSKYGK